MSFLRRLIDWLCRLWVYVLKEWNKPITTLAALPFSIFLASTVFYSWEEIFRYAGLALELLGISTVAIGLGDTRKRFGKPGAWELAVAKFKRIPSFRKHTTIVAGTGNLVVTGFDALIATGAVRPSPGSPLEERVTALEKALDSAREQILKAQHQISEEGKIRTAAILAENGERKLGDDNLRQALDDAVSGGIYLESMGLVWLVVGVILATASSEFAALFER